MRLFGPVESRSSGIPQQRTDFLYITDKQPAATNLKFRLQIADFRRDGLRLTLLFSLGQKIYTSPKL